MLAKYPGSMFCVHYVIIICYLFKDSLRQRVEEAVDIIVRHGFATTDSSPSNVSVAVNTSGVNVNVTSSDTVTTGSGNMDSSASVGTTTGSVQLSTGSGGGSGLVASPSDHSLLPDMDVFNLTGGLGVNKLKKEEEPPPSHEEPDDNAPLFYR